MIYMQELGELASSYGVCFHVDLCLGGFVLPFARQLGYVKLYCDFLIFHVDLCLGGLSLSCCYESDNLHIGAIPLKTKLFKNAGSLQVVEIVNISDVPLKEPFLFSG